jgi:hypothetical protein
MGRLIHDASGSPVHSNTWSPSFWTIRISSLAVAPKSSRTGVTVSFGAWDGVGFEPPAGTMLALTIKPEDPSLDENWITP